MNIELVVAGSSAILGHSTFGLSRMFVTRSTSAMPDLPLSDHWCEGVVRRRENNVCYRWLSVANADDKVEMRARCNGMVARERNGATVRSRLPPQ